MNDQSSIKLIEISKRSDLSCLPGTGKSAAPHLCSRVLPTSSDEKPGGSSPREKCHFKAKSTKKLKKGKPINLGQRTMGWDTP